MHIENPSTEALSRIQQFPHPLCCVRNTAILDSCIRGVVVKIGVAWRKLRCARSIDAGHAWHADPWSQNGVVAAAVGHQVDIGCIMREADMRWRVPGCCGEAAEGSPSWGVGRGLIRIDTHGVHEVIATPWGLRGGGGEPKTFGVPVWCGRGDGFSFTSWTLTLSTCTLETTWTSCWN